MTYERLQFDGWIGAFGTSSGTRVVLGHWERSPFGPFSDVMLERPDGRRLLLAPTARVQRFVGATYRFHESRIVPVSVSRESAGEGVGGTSWSVVAGPLAFRFRIGPRGALGSLLRTVPRRLAVRPGWSALCDVPVRLALPGVRTRGSAGGGRREWYAALDLWPLTGVSAVHEGADLGPLAAVDPPVRFGFGSAPRRPALVRVVSTVEQAARPA